MVQDNVALPVVGAGGGVEGGVEGGGVGGVLGGATSGAGGACSRFTRVEFRRRLKADLAPPERPEEPVPAAATGWATDAAAVGVAVWEVTGVEAIPRVMEPASNDDWEAGFDVACAEPTLEVA